LTARSTAQGHAATIRDEVSAGANTATRVGTNLRELADNVVFGEDAGTTDNRLLRSDGVSGAIQNSPITCDDSGNLTGLGTVSGRNVATDGTKLDLYPTVSGLTTGQCIRATGAATMAFGALDLANTNAVTGVLPITNVAAETPARIITALSTAASSIGVNSQKITNLAAASANGDAIRYEQFTDTFWWLVEVP
jgi:hypothetical protein